MRFGLLGSMRVVPSDVSECPSSVVGVEGKLVDLPSFGVHCPLKEELCEPDTVPGICGIPTPTEYVPSLLTPTLTLTSTVAVPVIAVSDFEVPRISCQVLP